MNVFSLTHARAHGAFGDAINTSVAVLDAPATKKHANTPPHLATVGGPADRVKSLNDSIFAGVEDIASNAGNTVAPIPLQKHAAPATPAAEPAKVPRGGSAAPSARVYNRTPSMRPLNSCES